MKRALIILSTLIFVGFCLLLGLISDLGFGIRTPAKDLLMDISFLPQGWKVRYPPVSGMGYKGVMDDHPFATDIAFIGFELDGEHGSGPATAGQVIWKYPNVVISELSFRNASQLPDHYSHYGKIVQLSPPPANSQSFMAYCFEDPEDLGTSNGPLLGRCLSIARYEQIIMTFEMEITGERNATREDFRGILEHIDAKLASYSYGPEE